MRMRGHSIFTTVRSEGALLPPDLLQRIVDTDPTLGGLTPSDYYLPGTQKLNEAINTSWNVLLGAWAAFRTAAEKLPPADPGTTATRERWLLPLFSQLGFGRLFTAKAIEIEDRAYPVSHQWQATPIHLVGLNVDLDKRTTGVAGAAKTTPHGLIQELLNRSKEHQWGIVSNGLRLRVLRDNVSLTRQAYVEFDLEAMMRDEVYPDFALLWLLCHQSRFETVEGKPPWLERWADAAKTEGTRALDSLRDGVRAAIEALGQGFLSHGANADLKGRLRSGDLSGQEYYRQLLRLVYRLIFLFVAEDRGLLFAPGATDQAKQRYQRFYSTARLRRLADRRRGTKHPDLYEALKLVMAKLGEDDGCPELALPGLGSFLWSPQATKALATCLLANADLLMAVRALSSVEDRKQKVRRVVDYRNMGSEELGSVYESLLEMHPELDAQGGTFSLSTAGGNERKTTGSYYTPSSLISALLDSALDPVLNEATRKPDPEAAILDLTVCDPATGSGHFLVAAAHRIAKRLAAVRTGDEEPSPEALRTGLRDVIGRCIYGVDVNPMAVELCKVSLWMEALEPGKPLSFLDHRIVCGNSLLGATPALLEKGIPDEAFAALEGDDKKVVSELKRRNKQERKSGQAALALGVTAASLQVPIASAVEEIDAIEDTSIVAVRKKEQRWTDLEGSAEMAHARLVANAWCAAFVTPKVPNGEVLTEGVFRRLADYPEGGSSKLKDQISELADQYRFLHWHLAFPEVFRVPNKGEEPSSDQGWSGGFDLVCGNPPWERVNLQEKEWFAARRPEIAAASNAAKRKKLIEALDVEDSRLYEAWIGALRQAGGASRFIRESGRYPLGGRGDVNTYVVFAELNRGLIDPTGRVGVILPTGIATDDTTKFLFSDLVQRRSLVSFYGFKNERFLFSKPVEHTVTFGLLTLLGSGRKSDSMEFCWLAWTVDQMRDPGRRYVLTAEDIELVNPNTHTAPVFVSKEDADLTKAIYRRVPVLVNEEAGEKGNPWGMELLRMFHMADDSGLFRTRQELEALGGTFDGNVFRRSDGSYLPLYEAKMIHQFNHRWGDYGTVAVQDSGMPLPDVLDDRLVNANYLSLPRYWVRKEEVDERLANHWSSDWLLGWRDIARNTDGRTVIAAVIPRTALGHQLPMALPEAAAEQAAALYANLDSFILDYVARQKVGGTHVTYFIVNQLPILPPNSYDIPTPWDSTVALTDWIKPRVLELSYTAWDLGAWARDLGWKGAPFHWDTRRRAQLRAELDAAFFHLYSLTRDEVDYVMDTFPIVRKDDEKRWRKYRTKRLILDGYDAMSKSIDTGVPYETILDPPPADGWRPPIPG